MAVPEGYSPLGRLGYVDRGTYAASTKYMKGDVVYYNGSTYTALKDNLTGVTPVNGSNWKYMARGFSADNLSNVQAKDTSGVIGTAGATVVSQALIDAIADKVMTKLLAKTDIVQTESTATNKVPSSAYLKSVKDDINSNLDSKANADTVSGLSADLNNVKESLSPLKTSLVGDINNNTVGVVNIVAWDSNTTSTPKSTGNTIYGNGFCLTYSTGNQWLCQLAMAVGDSHIFTRHRREGVWSGWTTIGTPSN